MNDFIIKRNEFIEKITQTESTLISNKQNKINLLEEIWSLDNAIKDKKIPRFLLDIFFEEDFLITAIFVTNKKDIFAFSISIEYEDKNFEVGIFVTQINENNLVLLNYQNQTLQENINQQEIIIENYKENSILDLAKNISLNIVFNPYYNFYLNDNNTFDEKTKNIDFSSLESALEKFRSSNLLNEDEQITKELFSKYKIRYLYHMTNIENLRSIFLYGLLSHIGTHEVFKVNKVDISNNNVQNRRSQVNVFDIPLHAFVPLYFNPKNAMLYSLQDQQSQIVFLVIKTSIFETDSLIFSDGNSASPYTKFYCDLDDLSNLKWDIIWADTWFDKPDGKRIKCAEALVYDRVEINYIEHIFCFSDEIKSKAESYVPKGIEINISINKSLYF